GPVTPHVPVLAADGQPALAQHAPEVSPLFLGFPPREVARDTSGPPAQRRVLKRGTTAPLLPREAASQAHGVHQPQLRMPQPPNICAGVQPRASAAGPASRADSHSITAAHAPSFAGWH